MALNDGVATVFVRIKLIQDASGEEGHYTGLLTTAASRGENSNRISNGSSSNASDGDVGLPHCGANGDCKYEESGRRFKGGWHMGKWHGHGKAWFPNGDIYEGEYCLDQRHGQGVYTWKDGRVYRGSFWNDLRHGEGWYKWKDGTAIYEGSFVKGQREGRGVYTFQGGKYTGEFQRGQYHGYGECIWEDGRTYKGEWKDGMAHGQGVETDKLGRILHQGEWQNDEPMEVRGRKKSSTLRPPSDADNNNNNADKNQAVSSTSSSIFTDMYNQFFSSETTSDVASKEPNNAPAATQISSKNNDDAEKLVPVVNTELSDSKGRVGMFRGMMLREMPHGVGHMVYGEEKEKLIATYQGFWDYGEWKQGRVEYRNGDIFQGDFSHFLRTGFGEYTWKDGRQYHGDYEKDVRQGHGQFHYPNGDMFEGRFVKGVRHGPGRFDFSDGSSYEGNFVKGEFHGQECKYIHKDGRVYLGDFGNGERNGYGKELYPDGSLRYEGEWLSDAPMHPDKIQPAPPGFILKETVSNNSKTNEDYPIDSVIVTKKKTPAIMAQTKDCKTVVEETVSDAQGNTGTFTGLVLKNSKLPHGVGRMVYVGEIREGFWKNGYLEGHARAFFANGDFYEGLFHQSQRQGPGVYKWKDGRVYEGDYDNDQRHGEGRFIYPSGDEYVGKYDNGMRYGQGKFTFSDGSHYKGGWKNSLYHGYGQLLEISTGGYYKGNWEEGKKHGIGEYHDGKRLHQFGEWHFDAFQRDLTVEEIEQLHIANPDARSNSVNKDPTKDFLMPISNNEEDIPKVDPSALSQTYVVQDDGTDNIVSNDDADSAQDLLSSENITSVIDTTDIENLAVSNNEGTDSLAPFSWGALDGENQRWQPLANRSENNTNEGTKVEGMSVMNGKNETVADQ
mmetsp:Transcript_40079/g.45609  ORF Transcript_40079/g.45609 Transcript_40079/m.45609 type:complete len:895 (+) Transcript_40079:32-2716(+)